MRTMLLAVGLLALACGTDSQALFEQGPIGVSAAGKSSGVSGAAPSAGGSSSSADEAGAAGVETSADAGAGGKAVDDPGQAGTQTGGTVTEPRGGAAGHDAGGVAGKPAGGSPTSEGGSSAGSGGKVSDGGVGAGGKPSTAGAGGIGGATSEVPAACAAVPGCMGKGPTANQGYCEISDLNPAGACVQCPNHYLDCDGPEPEVYGEPGSGCETFDSYMGKCP